MRKLAIASLLIGLLAGYGFYAVAQNRIDVRPSLTPIGSSSSNGTSFAWFLDSATRTVYLCRAGQAAGSALDCRTTANLP